VKKTFAGLHARTICHATEDLDKVRLAMRNAVGEVEQRISKTEGHHGNPITILEASVDDPKALDEFFLRIGDATVKEMLDSLDNRIDDGCNLFLKLDKQAALLGNLQMARNDDAISIRIKVSAFPARCSIARGMVDEYLRSVRA